MIDFIIKSFISLLVLLAFYLLILEREKMHQFNRFYLLFSIVISLIIPFLTFEIIKIVPVVQNIEPLNTIITSSSIPENKMQGNSIPIEEKINFMPYVLCSLYGLISFLLLIRFGKNIWKLISKSKSNPIVKFKNANLVLVDEKTLPHTFLNSIFINQHDYNNRNIEDELYTHELVHVTQKHTLDILFVEFLKVFFWFNPLLIFYKKAIQLNHEFLADEEIVKTYNNVPFYQNLLLQKGSVNQTIYLASNLNYVVTKKRLIMMTKKNSTRIALAKKLAIAPIMAILLFFLCFEIVAKEKIVYSKPIKKTSSINSNDPKTDAYFKGVKIIVYEKGVKTKTGYKGENIVLSKFYEDLTEADKKIYAVFLMMPKPFVKKSPTQKEINDFKNSKKYAIWIDDKNVNNKDLANYKPSDIAYFSGSVVLKNARTKKHPQPFQYWFFTHSYFDKNEMNKIPNKYPNDTIEIFNCMPSRKFKKN